MCPLWNPYFNGIKSSKKSWNSVSLQAKFSDNCIKRCVKHLYQLSVPLWVNILSDNTKNVNHWRSDDSVHNQLSEASISRLLHDPNIFDVFSSLLNFFSTQPLPFNIQSILDSKLLKNLKEWDFHVLSTCKVLKNLKEILSCGGSEGEYHHLQEFV